MKKTSLRLNNRFLVESSSKLLMSEVDTLDHWNEVTDLDSLTLEDVTSTVKPLLKKMNLTEKVNLIVSQSGGFEKRSQPSTSSRWWMKINKYCPT